MTQGRDNRGLQQTIDRRHGKEGMYWRGIKTVGRTSQLIG